MTSAGPPEAQRTLREGGEREGVVRALIAELLWQRARLRVAPAVGELGLEDSRGTGAEEHSDAPRPVARGTLGHLRGKSVLREGQPGEAIVAAVELGELPGQGGLIHTRNLADAGVEAHRLEAARGES